MNRTTARESVMQMLFQMEIQKDFSEEAKQTYIDRNIDEDDQLKYINSVYTSFVNNKEDIDKLIEEKSNGWKLNRIAKVDLCVMRVCLAESIFSEETEKTPIGVAINEAVKMAKKFSSEDAGKFINGILGQISRCQ